MEADICRCFITGRARLIRSLGSGVTAVYENRSLSGLTWWGQATITTYLSLYVSAQSVLHGLVVIRLFNFKCELF